MLTPLYYKFIPQRLLPLFEELEEYIIADISRRIAGSVGQVVTSSAQWQSWVLQEMGVSLDEIQAKIAQTLGKSEAEINALFDDAARRAIEYGEPIAESEAAPDTLDDLPALRDYAGILAKKARDEVINITRSMGFAQKAGGKTIFKPIAKFYQETLNFAHMQVQTGAISYTEAIKQAVNKLCGSGIKTVDYQTGWVNRVDVAVRRAVLSSIKDISRESSRIRGQRMKTTIFEISAHSGARPTHKEWQGKRFDTAGLFYPTEEELTHGELSDYGCRHDVYPVPDPAAPYTYTKEELKTIDPPPFVYEGKTYDAYQATQKQREIERAMRYTKTKLVSLRSVIGASPEGEKERLEVEFAVQAARLKRQRNLYADFSEKAHLREQGERAQVRGFNRSVSTKANAAARKGGGKK